MITPNTTWTLADMDVLQRRCASRATVYEIAQAMSRDVDDIIVTCDRNGLRPYDIEAYSARLALLQSNTSRGAA